jgi:predicted small lipoprotein YifL
MKRELRVLAAGALLAALVGCSSGGPKYVPVSGVVTLDGKPYGKAVVTFQPIGTPENPNPGRGSSAYTDENGRFVLKCDHTTDGAVVGKHLVRIMTRGADVVTDSPEGGTPDDAQTGRKTLDPIPPEWNSLSKVEFDVTPKGTDQANFEIKSRKRR